MEMESGDRVAAKVRLASQRERLQTAHEARAKVEADLVAALTENERLRGEPAQSPQLASREFRLKPLDLKNTSKSVMTNQTRQFHLLSKANLMLSE